MGLEGLSPLAEMRRALAAGEIDPVGVAERSVARANGSASKNTYLHLDAEGLRDRARGLRERFPMERPPLYGVPVSLKDCFDLAGTVTTCGSRFYERTNGVAGQDSAVAERLKEAGCLIVGKTHLHPLAYGITGQNPEYGDCLQPRDAGALTGGSSSGAAASVQEGSALVAVGTDTGGSVRVPAALSGLVGWRASQAMGTEEGGWPEMWRGGAHLAQTFDTLGLLFADPRDASVLVGELFRVKAEAVPGDGYRVGCVGEDFLGDCEPEVMEAYRLWKRQMERAGAVLGEFRTDGWEEATEIFAGVQASEAAALHRGHYAEFEAGIAQRLAWGALLSAVEVRVLRRRMGVFRARMEDEMARFDVMMLPCAPVSRLSADVDPGAVRQRILQYTTPVSLAGMPAAALPGELVGGAFGTGVQMAAVAGGDAGLLGWVDRVAESLVG